MKKCRRALEMEIHRDKIKRRLAGEDPCHMWGFPVGASGKKRAYRIYIRSPYFSLRGFFHRTRNFSSDWWGHRPKRFFRLEKADKKFWNVRRVKKIKIL